jgi:hypothetical protein
MAGALEAGALEAKALEDGTVRRARLEVSRVEGLVATGVLPRASLQKAQDALADAEEDAAIRSSLTRNDFTVAEAEALVELTTRRVARRQKVVDTRNQLLAQGIIARSEVTGAESDLTNALNDLNWATERARLTRELDEMARNEQDLMRQAEGAGASGGSGLVEHFAGTAHFDLDGFPQIEKAFEARFAHALPVSAMGETEVHKSLGFDHRNRVDVALVPDQPEGQWLRHYLTAHNIPFFAFRGAVAHQATGAHIHIGPPSDRYVSRFVKPRIAAGGD